MYEKVNFWLCLNAVWNYWWNWLADCKSIYRSRWSMVNSSNVFDFGDIEGYIILLFYALAVVGTIVATKALKRKRSKFQFDKGVCLYEKDDSCYIGNDRNDEHDWLLGYTKECGKNVYTAC